MKLCSLKRCFPFRFYQTYSLLTPDPILSIKPKPNDVFANTYLKLSKIKAYGFDYDYTLASYNSRAEHAIYDLGVEALIEWKGYPEEIRAVLKGAFDPKFAIRGLSYDKRTGFLMKMDQFGQIEASAVYCGRQKVPEDVVRSTYNDHTRLSRDYMNNQLHYLSDLFSLPEACLLADVTEYFRQREASFYPLHLYQDVISCISRLHRSETIHQTIAKDPERYIDPSPALHTFLKRLKDSGKKTFLLSNSRFWFIDAGMRFMLGDQWRSYFDAICVKAEKPKWYETYSRFRRFDTETRSLSFAPVDAFVPGEVYTHGSLEEFHKLLGISGDKVLYMGDQIYTDLLIPQRMAVWKTAAIIKEVQSEIVTMESEEYRMLLSRLLQVESMLDQAQKMQMKEHITDLKQERREIGKRIKNMFNPYFGSMFRTYQERSLFFFNVCRVADIYTSAYENLLEYPLDYAFQIRRVSYPHEPIIPFPT